MIFLRRWLLVLPLLALGGGSRAAATREEQAFTAAAAAFQNGIYDRAEAGFDRFISAYKNSTNVPLAVLLKAQAQFKQGKFMAASATLAGPPAPPGTLADQYDYWLGEARFARGDYEGAAATFTNLLQRFAKSPLRLPAVVGAAAALEKMGDWPGVEELLGGKNSVFLELAAANPSGEITARGWLLLARAQFEQNEFAAALATLKRIDPAALPKDLQWQHANLLCRIQAGAGDLEAALGTSSNLLQLARPLDAGRLADSVAWRGTVLERLGRWNEAGQAWSENLTNTAPEEWQREAVLRLAAAAAAQANFAAAQARLADFLAQYPGSPAAPQARLTLGELQLKDYVADATAANQLVQARTNFDRLLALATNNPLAGKAFLDRGWCNWLAGLAAQGVGDTNAAAQKIAASLADFSAAGAALPFSEDLAVARFKAGDARFALRDFRGAAADYRSVLEQFGAVPDVMRSLGARVLYQTLRANLELKDAAGAEAAMREMLDKFPESELADNSLLLLAEGFSDWGLATNAFGAYHDFTRLFPGSPLAPQAGLAVARAFERAGNLPAAITNYAGWLGKYPTNTLRPQAEYALGRAYWLAGDETSALAQFAGLVARFPASPLAPPAQWWVADHYFRLGGTNFTEAEKNYELIFQTPAWQGETNLFYPAKLMAGRAAAGRQGFADANGYFLQLLNDPGCGDDVKNQARLAYAASLMQTPSADTNNPALNFQLATNVLAQLPPTNEAGVFALGQMADCNLQLGAFDAATNFYAQVVASPLAGPALRSRAQVGLGIVLEKKADLVDGDARLALLAQARDQYQDVLDAYRAGDLPDAFWAKKAGLQELGVLPKTGVKDLNQFYSDLETLLPPLKETLEQKRAALKN